MIPGEPSGDAMEHQPPAALPQSDALPVTVKQMQPQPAALAAVPSPVSLGFGSIRPTVPTPFGTAPSAAALGTSVFKYSPPVGTSMTDESTNARVLNPYFSQNPSFSEGHSFLPRIDPNFLPPKQIPDGVASAPLDVCPPPTRQQQQQDNNAPYPVDGLVHLLKTILPSDASVRIGKTFPQQAPTQQPPLPSSFVPPQISPPVMPSNSAISRSGHYIPLYPRVPSANQSSSGSALGHDSMFFPSSGLGSNGQNVPRSYPSSLPEYSRSLQSSSQHNEYGNYEGQPMRDPEMDGNSKDL